MSTRVYTPVADKAAAEAIDEDRRKQVDETIAAGSKN